jgi:predicted nucleic acid-binding protein
VSIHPGGATIALADLTIGVQAVLDDAMLVTANTKHFERIPAFGSPDIEAPAAP